MSSFFFYSWETLAFSSYSYGLSGGFFFRRFLGDCGAVSSSSICLFRFPGLGEVSFCWGTFGIIVALPSSSVLIRLLFAWGAVSSSRFLSGVSSHLDLFSVGGCLGFAVSTS